jgi:hypothetical protein
LLRPLAAQRMESLGNERCHELYGEAGRSRVSETVDGQVLEVHVRDKYAKIKPAPGPLPAASGKLYRCEPTPDEAAAATLDETPTAAESAESALHASHDRAAAAAPVSAKPKAPAAKARSGTGAKSKARKAKSGSSKLGASSLSGSSAKAKKAAAAPATAR